MYTSQFNMIFNLFIIFLAFTSCTANEMSIENMLTKNEVKEWYKNLTSKQHSSNPYCQICCINMSPGVIRRNCGSHTMCIFDKSEVGPSCKGYIEMTISQIEKDAIVDAHNTLRNRVAGGEETGGNPGPQPPAANMRVLEWNDELAVIAERWAQQCVYGSDYCRDTTRFPVGQNLARGNLTASNELLFIKEWYSAINKFSGNDSENYRGTNRKASPYTQLVWADTSQVGCARAFFQKVVSDKVTYVEQFFCNYGPTGNIPGQPVYRTGTPCSFCPEGTGRSPRYHNLCENEINFRINDTEYTTDSDAMNNNKGNRLQIVIQIILPAFLAIFQ